MRPSIFVDSIFRYAAYSRMALPAVALIMLCSGMLSAQAVSGNIAGTVQDASGAGVPNTAITITDLGRGSVFHTQSSGDGNYSQTHLLAGRYSVKVGSRGFCAYSATADV